MSKLIKTLATFILAVTMAMGAAPAATAQPAPPENYGPSSGLFGPNRGGFNIFARDVEQRPWWAAGSKRAYARQGEKIDIYTRYGQYYTSCTLGFTHNGRGYTAGHCLPIGGAQIYMDGKRIATNSMKWHTGRKDNDWGTFDLLPYVKAENGITGNRIASMPKKGDTVCHYARQSNREVCNRVTGFEMGSAVVVNGSTTGIGGDSGGPFYTKNGGIVGVYIGRGPGENPPYSEWYGVRPKL